METSLTPERIPLTMSKDVEYVANKICNHFMQKCEAKICKHDYEFVVGSIMMHLLGDAKSSLSTNESLQ